MESSFLRFVASVHMFLLPSHSQSPPFVTVIIHNICNIILKIIGKRYRAVLVCSAVSPAHFLDRLTDQRQFNLMKDCFRNRHHIFPGRSFLCGKYTVITLRWWEQEEGGFLSAEELDSSTVPVCVCPKLSVLTAQHKQGFLPLCVHAETENSLRKQCSVKAALIYYKNDMIKKYKAWLNSKLGVVVSSCHIYMDLCVN